MALIRSGARTHLWDIAGPMPSAPLDVWLVVLDAWASPASCVDWLRLLNAPTLFISPHVLAALQASECIPHPVLVSSPTAAWDALQELLTMLSEMTVGKVLLHSGIAPYTLV